MSRRGDLLSALILFLAGGLGIWAFIRPMTAMGTSIATPVPRNLARASDAPIILLVLLGLCLLVVVANLETRRMDARTIAVLGALVGINACLRLVSGPMGSSAFFILPILCGYVFGADFGFLLATLAMLTSALLTGGIGPWMPFQMIAGGWCGMISGWLPRLPFSRAKWMLALWGAIAGFLYGAVINLWFWPLMQPTDITQHWQPDLTFQQTALRYAVFYIATSSWWDAGRALGNALLLLALGEPILRLLSRFQKRFRFRVFAEGNTLPEPPTSDTH